MTAIKFYYDVMSPPSRALLVFFKMANIPFESKMIALRKQEHLTEDFQKNIGKFNRLPVIHDGDFKLTESIAILRYVTQKYQVDDFWYPKNAKDRARVDEFLSWTHNNIRMATGMAFFTKFRDPILSGNAADPEKVKRNDRDLQKILNDMEELWTGNAFISGDKFTFADVLASCDLEQTRMTGIDPLVKRPKLAAWMERTKKQLEPHFTESHKYIYIVEEIVKNKE